MSCQLNIWHDIGCTEDKRNFWRQIRNPQSKDKVWYFGQEIVSDYQCSIKTTCAKYKCHRLSHCQVVQFGNWEIDLMGKEKCNVQNNFWSTFFVQWEVFKTLLDWRARSKLICPTRRRAAASTAWENHTIDITISKRYSRKGIFVALERPKTEMVEKHPRNLFMCWTKEAIWLVQIVQHLKRFVK